MAKGFSKVNVLSVVSHLSNYIRTNILKYKYIVCKECYRTKKFIAIFLISEPEKKFSNSFNKALCDDCLFDNDKYIFNLDKYFTKGINTSDEIKLDYLFYDN
jgi:hypothetical protein